MNNRALNCQQTLAIPQQLLGRHHRVHTRIPESFFSMCSSTKWAARSVGISCPVKNSDETISNAKHQNIQILQVQIQKSLCQRHHATEDPQAVVWGWTQETQNYPYLSILNSFQSEHMSPHHFRISPQAILQQGAHKALIQYNHATRVCPPIFSMGFLPQASIVGTALVCHWINTFIILILVYRK
jgi:hypothetical protein